MPLKKLIPLCKEFGILTIIDGTHAPGQIPLDLASFILNINDSLMQFNVLQFFVFDLD
jgi:cysteine sulfinate desulfinase/cysteine desulfurase-like protein